MVLAFSSVMMETYTPPEQGKVHKPTRTPTPKVAGTVDRLSHSLVFSPATAGM